MICAYCGLDGPTTFDHVVPRSAGGSAHYSNGVAACLDCNRRKNARPAMVAPCGRLTWLPGKCVHHACQTCPSEPTPTLFNVREIDGDELALVEAAAAIKAATARRDELICVLRERGASLRQIASLADLSHQSIVNVMTRLSGKKLSEIS